MQKLCVFGALAVAAGSVSMASGAIVNATITADNHYSLYSRIGNSFTFHGGGEMGSGGAPGQYNWSEPENYTFSTNGLLYIAAWSDDSIAQGVLAEISAGQLNLNSGNPLWEVFATGVNRGDGDGHPTIVDLSGQVGIADIGNLWEPTYIGGANGIAPWGAIAGITANANWMWYDNGAADPLQPGNGVGEYLIFRIAVPTPGSLALLGLGGALVARRRR